MQSHHITDGTNQLDTCVIVEVAYLIAAAFEFFHVRRGNTHHIGQLVHTFFALIENGFQFVHAFQRVHHLIGGFGIRFPCVVFKVFQFFFLITHGRECSLIGYDLDIHARVDRKIKLLLLEIENLAGRKIQFTYHIGDRKVCDIAFRILGLDTHIPLLFLNQTAGRLDKIVPLNQRITLTLFERQRKLKILIRCAGSAVDMLQQIAKVVLIQPAYLETAGQLIFHQLFHAGIAANFIVRHTHEVTHERVTDSVYGIVQQVLCCVSYFLNGQFLIRYDQLKTDEKAVIDLCITERSNQIFRLLVNLGAGDLFQPSGHAFLGTLLCGANTAFRTDLQSMNLAITVLRDQLPESIMHRVFLFQ